MDLARHLLALTGAGALDEQGGGHQGRVVAATGGTLDRRLAVKAVAADGVDRAEHEARVEVVRALAATEPVVCTPVPLAGRLVTELATDDGPVLVTAYEWAEGRPLDPGHRSDAAAMGRTLARLHRSMATVDAAHLPPVPALRAVPGDALSLNADLDDQLLHGDANLGNLRIDGTTVRVFDLDDCGRGPALFDVADALYMARFASEHDPAAAGSHAVFEAGLLEGYAAGSGTTVDRDVVAALLDLRLRAVLVWLDDLDRAPVGIRTASPAWHAVLRAHAERFLGG